MTNHEQRCIENTKKLLFAFEFSKKIQEINSQSARKQLVEHCVKSVRILNFSGTCLPAFGPGKLRIRTLFTKWNRLFFQE